MDTLEQHREERATLAPACSEFQRGAREQRKKRVVFTTRHTSKTSIRLLAHNDRSEETATTNQEELHESGVPSPANGTAKSAAAWGGAAARINPFHPAENP